jgi:hypothetical protein
MSATPTQSSGQLGALDLIQLAKLLSDYSSADSEAGNASAAARDMAGNLRVRSNITNDAADQYLALVKALQSQVSGDPATEIADLEGRTNQIFSALAPSVDRGNAIAASQGYSQALKRGMGDSTQASDAAKNLTRNFGDVYQKLQEVARQRAFDELKTNKQLAGQNLSTATSGLMNLNNLALTNARELQSAASRSAGAAQQNLGKNFTDTISSNASKWLLDKVDAGYKEAGGFDGLLTSLRNGLGFGGEATASSGGSSDGGGFQFDGTNDINQVSSWGGYNESNQGDLEAINSMQQDTQVAEAPAFDWGNFEDFWG